MLSRPFCSMCNALCCTKRWIPCPLLVQIQTTEKEHCDEQCEKGIYLNAPAVNCCDSDGGAQNHVKQFIRRVCMSTVACAAVVLLIFNAACMELPFSSNSRVHEFDSTKWTALQQAVDLRCGLPKLREAREFSISAAAAYKQDDFWRGTIADEGANAHALAKLGIHYVRLPLTSSPAIVR